MVKEIFFFFKKKLLIIVTPLKRFQEKGGTGMVTVRIGLLLHSRDDQSKKV